MSWFDAYFAQMAPPSSPRVLRCDNCGAPLGTRCSCRNVIAIGRVVGRAPDPACTASTHDPGRLVCRFCGVENS